MHLEKVLLGLDWELRGSPCGISGLACDSRRVQPGDLFVAISGYQVDGHRFVHDAQQRGATAVVVERWIPDLDIPQVKVGSTRIALSRISANFYGHPGRKLRVLGVTGTNGKTTSTYFLRSIFNAAGYRVGVIGTIEVRIGDRTEEAVRTTPDALSLQRMLSEMVSEGIEVAILEVSSHALALHRTDDIDFDGALFTNLSQDHLDFHSDLDDYFLAKAKLFDNLKGTAALNYDERWGRELAARTGGDVISYGVEQAADVTAEKIELEKSGVSYILKSKEGQTSIDLRLTGYFNVLNSLGAAALAFGLGVDLNAIKAGLEGLSGVPGRFERIENAAGLNVIVDYAHTPAGLENILQTARALVSHGRLFLVFGAGGDRDRAKRPLMGAAAGRLADVVIITSDNPRSEDPAEICSQIETGLLTVDSPAEHMVVLDRRAAIRTAINMASPDDLVIIAGKGHETYQEFADGRIHFDDGEEVRAAIKELK